MGKSYRNDAKNDKWRKAKQQRDSKKGKGKYIVQDCAGADTEGFEQRPWQDNEIGGLNDYAHGM